MTMGDMIVVMHEGLIQQAASPREVYERPRNVFVATFIGTPQMNLFEGVLRKVDGRVCAVFGDICLPLDAKMAALPSVSDFLEKPVTFGLRPTDLHDIRPQRAHSEWEITLPLERRELLGAEVNLYFRLGEREFTAVVGNQTTAQAGDMVPITFDMEKLHIFDAESGQSIVHGQM